MRKLKEEIRKQGKTGLLIFDWCLSEKESKFVERYIKFVNMPAWNEDKSK